MKYFYFLICTIILSGCARNLYLYEGEALPDDQHAVIAMSGVGAVLRAVDGRQIFGKGDYFRIYMKPGSHTVDLFLQHDFGLSGGSSYGTMINFKESSSTITMNFEAGHKYDIGSINKNGQREFFILDLGTEFDEECFDIRYRNGVFNPEGKCPWPKK